ncbi:MAG: hypothetical protein LRZ93_02310 [Clostridiales bacterium]|nr:hypothetical protein [Clostridiales bacterium]
MKRVFTRLIIMTLIFTLLFSMTVLAEPDSSKEFDLSLCSAEEYYIEIEENHAPMGYWEYWEYESRDLDYTTVPIGNWNLCFIGTPATREGETQTAIATLTASTSLSGTVRIPIKVIEANLGYEIGVAMTVGGSTTSARLKIGEYIKGYAKPIASVSSVLQRKWIHMDGQKIRTNETKTVYGYRPTAVAIKIEYFKSGTYAQTLAEDKPYKVEYFIILNSDSN